MIKASAYVKQGRLIIIGVAQLRIGPVPFTYDCVVPEGTPEGPLDLNQKGSETLEQCLTDAEKGIRKRIQKGAIKVGAENLVLRARQGDQNALAMLMAIRKNAKAKVPKALVAFKAVKEYIEDHPPTEDVRFGYEIKKNMSLALAKHVEADTPMHYALGVLTILPHLDVNRSTVLLADGPLITKNLIDAICKNFSIRQSEQFIAGFSGKYVASKPCQLGHVFRKAKELQALRKGAFHLCNPIISYELGV